MLNQENLRREAEEARDRAAEEQHEKRIRELQNAAPGKLTEGLQEAQIQHLNNLKKEKEEQEKFVEKVEKMKQDEHEQHQAKMAEKLRMAELRMQDASEKCDVVTQVALDKMLAAGVKMTEESRKLEEEIAEGNAKSAVIEVDVSSRVFDEVDAQKDKDEFLSEKRAEEIRKQHQAIQQEEKNVLDTERAQRKENAKLTIAEIRSDLKDQQQMGMFNLGIQHSADDRKNRRQVNEKIMEVRNLLVELDNYFGRTSGVLNATPEVYAKIKRTRLMAIRGHLGRFSEILSSISIKLSEIEQNLASLELKDVEMNDDIRSIKTQISSFGQVIANLRLTLELEGVPIDPEKAEQFASLKQELFNSINSMPLVPENREVIQQRIQQRQDDTMPHVEKHAIEN